MALILESSVPGGSIAEAMENRQWCAQPEKADSRVLPLCGEMVARGG